LSLKKQIWQFFTAACVKWSQNDRQVQNNDKIEVAMQ